MALETLNAPVRSTPGFTSQTVRNASVEQAEKSRDRSSEAAQAEVADSADAAPRTEASAISGALRGSIVNLVV